MAFIPLEYTKDGETRLAETPQEAVWLSYNGWVLVGQAPSGPPPPPYLTKTAADGFYATLASAQTAQATADAALFQLIDAGRLTTGTLPAARIPAMDAGKITSGTFAEDRIPDLDASKITAGTFPAAQIPSLDASKITTGALAADRIVDLDAGKVTTGTFTVARIPSLDAAKITTGVFTAAQIPALDAAKVTTGVFTAAQIPALDAAKVTTGTFALARIPTLDATKIPALDAAKITTGVFTPAQIPALDAAKVTTGTFALAQIPTLDASKIPALDATKITTGTISVARIPALDTSKITTGVFTAAQIPALDAAKVTTGAFALAQIPVLDATKIPNLDAAKVTTGTFTAAQIPALDTSKVTTGTFATARIPDLSASYGTVASVAGKVGKGVEQFNVMDYGAIGDGVANDAAALTAAIAAAYTGGTIFIPGGKTIRCTTPVIVTKRLTLTGGGTVLMPTTNTELFTLGPAANGTIFRDLTLTGPTVTTYGGSSKAIWMLGTAAATRVKDVTVEGCTISGFSYGIAARLADRLVVRRNTITNLRYAGIHTFSVNGSKFLDNTIDTVTVTSPQIDAYGIAINRIENVTIVAEPLSQDNIIKGNHVANVDWEGIDTHGGINLVIDSNYVYKCKNGIALVAGGNELNVETYAPKAVTVTNNIVESGVTDGSAQAGIKLVGVGTGAGALTDPGTGVISNNYIRGHGLIGSTNAVGIIIYYTNGVSITGNTIIEPSTWGICLYHTNRGTSICGNTIIDPWHPTTLQTTPYGIFLRDADNNAVIDGNYVGLGAKTAGTKLYRGISMHSSATGQLGFNLVTGASNANVVGAAGMKTDLASYEIGFHDNSASTRKLGFFGVAPVSRPATTPANATDLATALTLVNSLKTSLKNFGLIP